MNLKFFILQAHYRGTLDFSNEALIAAGKGLERIMNALKTLEKLKPTEKGWEAPAWKSECYAALNEDLNTPILIAQLFEAVKVINSVDAGKMHIDSENLEVLKSTFCLMVSDILGLEEETNEIKGGNEGVFIQLLIDLRAEAKAKKDFATSDAIRNKLLEAGVQIMDTKEGTTFTKI